MPKRAIAVLVLIAAAVAVGVVVRSRPDADGWVYGSGVIEATEVDVSAQVSGQLIAVRVDEGDSVRKGDVLAEIEPDYLEAQLRAAVGAASAAKAELSRAEAALSGAALSLQNARAAYEKSTELKGRYDRAQAEHEAAVAARDRARARLELVRAGAREEAIEQARAAAESAEAEWENAQRDLARLETLVAEGAVSQQQVDSQRTAERAARGARDGARARLAELLAGARTEEEREAEATLVQTEANVAVAERALGTARELYADKLELKQRADVAEAEYLSAQQAKAAATGRLETAEAALAAAQKGLSDAVVEAPLDAVVLLKIREAGEMTAPGQPIVRLGDLDRKWLRVYVSQTQISRVKLGQQAEVTIDADPQRALPGTVSEISQEAEFTPKNVQTREQRTKLVVGVKIVISDPDGELKPGMPADARIRVAAEGDDVSDR
jgi:HlyD family secretion protein